MDALLDLHRISVMRGDKVVLRDLTLRVGVGEHVAILGPNGSGKSTLIKTITRECYPVQRDGSFMTILGDDRWDVFRLRSLLGIVTNDLLATCTREFTGLEIVLSGFFSSIGIWPHHQVTDEMRAKAATALELMEISHLADRPVEEMSSGEARRVVIARALVHDPLALLLDEPSNSLDVLAQHELRQTLRKLANSGIGIILVTHHLDDIIPEIDRVILLREGRIVADGPKARVLTTGMLQDVFGMPVEPERRADLNEVYSFLWSAHGDDYAVLDGSLSPRSPEYIFELAASAGLCESALVADVGCGGGKHCFELADRFGCRAIGFDVVLEPLQKGVHERSDDRVLLAAGQIERLPLRDGSADFVWCRDMLVHVADIGAALQECARILRPSGKMLLYTTLETDLMEPREAARLYAPLALRPVRRDSLERGFADAGLRTAHVEEIGSELIEYYEERDGRASRELMRIARMRRMRERLVAEWGTARYNIAQALYHWMTYLLVGKLTAAYYVLEKR